MSDLSRRRWIKTGLAAGAGVAGVAVAARLAESYGLMPPGKSGIYAPGEALTYASQRLLTRNSLAREFGRSEISKAPFANGKAPEDEEFQKLKAGGYAEWRLKIGGLVARPGSFSLDDLKRFPARSQITHLACEEGWSFIAEWVGVPLAQVLQAVGAKPEARYVIYESMEKGWADSMDMADALHPQTYLTYGMNGGALPEGHGGPLRMRVPRQLGYKSVKFVNRLTVVEKLGAFTPEGGYSWYAGI